MNAGKKVRNALLSVLPEEKVWHNKAHKKEPPYVIWMGNSAQGKQTDNRTSEQVTTGSAHLFTLQEYDTLVTMIEAAFTNAGFPWYQNSVQYEDETGYTHYEWIWAVN